MTKQKETTRRPKNRTIYTVNHTKQIKPKKMTVPGLAISNKQHVANAKMGLSEKAVKLIFDPENIFPDIRAMDLIDKRAATKQAREIVQDLTAKRNQALKQMEEAKKVLEEQKAKAEEERIEKLVKKNSKPKEIE